MALAAVIALKPHWVRVGFSLTHKCVNNFSGWFLKSIKDTFVIRSNSSGAEGG